MHIYQYHRYIIKLCSSQSWDKIRKLVNYSNKIINKQTKGIKKITTLAQKERQNNPNIENYSYEDMCIFDLLHFQKWLRALSK